MWHRFFEAYSPESIKKAELKPCLILSGEFIPGELLLSRARLRFNSSMQNSNEKTIFTTCQKRQPFTERVKKQRITHGTNIDVSDFKNGMYLITVKRNNEIIIKTKIIKE